MSSTKLAVDNRSVYVSFDPKTEKVYIPLFKRNNKEKTYFARLDKGKNSDVDADVSKPTVRKHNKFVFVPTLSLKLRKFISLLLRGIIKKMLILLG